MMPFAVREYGEYREMPGLRLTVGQAARLFRVALMPPTPYSTSCDARRFLRARTMVLLHRSVNRCRRRTAALAASDATAGTNYMSTQVDTDAAANGSLRDASLERLACLQRHWMWADEAMATFDRELAVGWDDDDDPMSDRPF